METVTISPKYQVILPKEICDLLSLFPGQRLHVIDRGNRIEVDVQAIRNLACLRSRPRLELNIETVRLGIIVKLHG